MTKYYWNIENDISFGLVGITCFGLWKMCIKVSGADKMRRKAFQTIFKRVYYMCMLSGMVH